MRRSGWTVFIVVFSMLAATPATHAQKRVALVIGNSAYEHTQKLANPKNDATDVAAALSALGFQIVGGFDLDKATFDRKVRDFATALQGAEVGLFFFAGHGLQVAGQNYLVPVDAQLTTASALEFEMVRIDVVQRVMEHETNTNILFLDACRDNPLARNLARAMGTRSAEVGRGFAPVASGVGTLISFSTQPGNVALDGTGRNSPFAGALVKHLIASKDDLSAILIDVRNDVMRETRNRQVPWEHSALRGRFYFNAPIQGAATPTPAPQPQLSEAERAYTRIAQYVEWEYLRDLEEFDSEVDYYQHGLVSREFVMQHRRKHALDWPIRRYDLVPGTLEISPHSSGQYVVTFQFTYIVAKKKGARPNIGSGRTRLTLKFEHERFLVTGVKEETKGAK